MKITKNKSGFYGVYVKPDTGYETFLTFDGKYKYLRCGKDPIALAVIYDDFIRENGLNRPLNFPAYPLNDISNTRQIQLGHGRFAIVDESDYDWLNQWKWHARKSKYTYYAMSWMIGKDHDKKISMHNLIMGISPDGLIVDHIDTIGTHNFRSNLRFCTQSENMMNQSPQIGKTSKYKGVYWDNTKHRWKASIHKNGQKVWSKTFGSEIEAAIGYNEKALELFGQYARLNVIE